MTLAATTLTASVKSLALDMGFDLVAIGPCEPPAHGAPFRRWIEAGHAGTMGYLERRLEERLDPQRVLPGARAVVCVALNYHQGAPTDASWQPERMPAAMRSATPERCWSGRSTTWPRRLSN